MLLHIYGLLPYLYIFLIWYHFSVVFVVPQDVPIKRTDSSQWWELFDTNTQRFYYYNAATQKTVWHRPSKCDIIPLAKLQTLKQNTDPSDRKESSTQTQHTTGSQSQSTSATQSPLTAVGKMRAQRSVVREAAGLAAMNNTNTGGSVGKTGKRGSAGMEGRSANALPLHASSEEKLSAEFISSPRGRHSFR